MKTHVFQTINGPVARVPLLMPDRKRSFRRLRPILGRKPVAIDSGNGAAIYAHRDSLAALIHFKRLARFIR